MAKPANKLPERIRSAMSTRSYRKQHGKNISEAIDALYSGELLTWDNIGIGTVAQFKAWVEFNGLQRDHMSYNMRHYGTDTPDPLIAGL